MSIEGLVTKSINIGDNNKLISILTKEQGIIYAFINNCKKMNSKLLASSEILSYSQFVLFKNKEKYCVNEAQILSQFPKIRQDIDKLSLSCYFLQLFNELVGENQNSEDYLRLILNSLYVLDNNKKDLITVKLVTELKVACIAGYMPNLICCSNPSSINTKTKFFFLMSGELKCNECYTSSNNIKDIQISSGILLAMRYIIYSDISKIFSFKLSSSDLLTLSKLTQTYLLFKTDLNLSTLKYFNNLHFSSDEII